MVSTDISEQFCYGFSSITDLAINNMSNIFKWLANVLGGRLGSKQWVQAYFTWPKFELLANDDDDNDDDDDDGEQLVKKDDSDDEGPGAQAGSKRRAEWYSFYGQFLNRTQRIFF